jgi:two-component system nitrogen regulation sensor histidine kinase NtrY
MDRPIAARSSRRDSLLTGWMSAGPIDVTDHAVRDEGVTHGSRGPLATRFGALAVVLALCCVLATFTVFSGFSPIVPTGAVAFGLLAANAVVILVLLALVAWELWRLVKARRAQAAAARLHIRIVSLFSVIAAAPALIMAVIGALTFERVLNHAFVQDLGGFIEDSRKATTHYADAECRTLVREAEVAAADLDRGKAISGNNPAAFHDYFASKVKAFAGAAIMKRNGEITEQVGGNERAPIFTPSAGDFDDAVKKDVVCAILNDGQAFAALRELTAFDSSFLYVVRPIDPFVSSFASEADYVSTAYQLFDGSRRLILIFFAVEYVLLALIMLLSAIWLGLSFANRLVAPIRRLIGATDQVSSGNLYVQVPIKRSEGDLAHLGQTFNKMTTELRQQHNRLLAANRLIDERRVFTEAVLSGVPAAVIGVNARGAVTMLNPSAEKLLAGETSPALRHGGEAPHGESPGDAHASAASIVGEPIDQALPELRAKINEALAGRLRLYQSQIVLNRGGRERIYNMRVTTEPAAGIEQSFVVTLDDMTDLVAAQRSSAWADVARRIAHEIKNPLTPIQLSAERLKRKYGRVITEDRDVFDQCTDTIVRQVDDIKRMVDEFSSFARMPRAKLQVDDLSQCIRQVLFERRVAHPDVTFTDNLPDAPVIARFDRRLLSQALTNITKNAAEGIAAAGDAHPGQVWLRLDQGFEGWIVIDIIDNGRGFPKENRQRLLEPYVTTRAEGTGLGLPIVARILEDHDGGIELLDAPTELAPTGGMVRLYFPADYGEAADQPSQTEPTTEKA